MPPRPVLELRDLDITSGRELLVRRLRLDAYPGRVLAVVADSAPVRDALVAVLTGQARGYTVAGDVALDGRDLLSTLAGGRRSVALVTAPSEGRRTPVELASLEARALAGVIRDRERVGNLDAAERTRVAYAVAAAAEPALVLVSVPYDAERGTTYPVHAEVLHRWSGQVPAAVIVLTDSLAVAADVADDVLVMLGAHAVEWGSVYDVCLRPVMPYVQDLLRVTPAPHRPLPDAPAPAGYAPHGCPWVLSCHASVRRECSQAVPHMQWVAPGHAAACHLIGAVDDAHA